MYFFVKDKYSMADNIIKKEDLKKFAQLTKFLEKENLSDTFMKSLKKEIRGDLLKLSGLTYSSINALRGQSGWYAELILATINSLDATRYMHTMPDDLAMQDADETLNIDIKTLFRPAITPGSEFGVDITISGDNKASETILQVVQYGGEITYTEIGGEEKTAYINAVRGERTKFFEDTVEQVLEGYFAEHLNEIDEEINKQFEKWLKDEKIEYKKG